ncbi:MAG: M1 family metallopeptidase [Crocinitomicaceae bacterium]|nr:M1 family metallopeptidase [Crocinitomicaceae bacterium]
MIKFFRLLLLLVVSFQSFAQRPIDVQSYYLSMSLMEPFNEILCEIEIDILFTEDCDAFVLDLVSQDEDGTGMLVTLVLEEDEEVNYEQTENTLIIHPVYGQNGQDHRYTVFYRGIPKDGLVIGQNKFGNRTIFGDNWPNRAHNWFPCVDHPSDKATIGFLVLTSDEYNVVANGILSIEETLDGGTYLAEYKSIYPLSTKVMVIGVAALVSEELENDHGIPHYNWVYPEDEEDGFHDMKVAADPLDFFIKNIGSYPFDKLFNVQSTTRFGGMENAGCIFYDENAVTGEGTMENLIAHEIAHQWFGNSATEADWPHLWLSEGFATYFTNLYLEDKYGRQHMNEQLIKDRKRVIRFHKASSTPVVDTISTDLMYLLNPNSYQKGSWVLHMLRNKIGDDAFWSGIRAYYEKYKYSNASTEDFMHVMEEVSGAKLSTFFNQWLRQTGHPMLSTELTTDGSKLIITQHQSSTFNFPLTILYNYEGGSTQEATFEVFDHEPLYILLGDKKVTSVDLDPHVNLLFELVETSER